MSYLREAATSWSMPSDWTTAPVASIKREPIETIVGYPNCFIEVYRHLNLICNNSVYNEKCIVYLDASCIMIDSNEKNIRGEKGDCLRSHRTRLYKDYSSWQERITARFNRNTASVGMRERMCNDLGLR